MRYRFRPIGKVIEEVKRYRRNFLVFVDDNIAGNHDYSREIFDALKRCKKRWVAQSSIDIAEEDGLLRLAAESGCAGLLIGFESINQGNKEDVRKLRKTSEYIESIKRIKAYKIGIHGSFVFGFDNDTTEVFQETVGFVMDNRLEVANYCKLTPFPGTKIFDILSREGRILHSNWSRYDRYNIVFRPKNISIEELKKRTDEVYRKTYSIQSILRRLPLKAKNIPSYLTINLSYRSGSKRRSL